jgi:hypothetical protein
MPVRPKFKTFTPADANLTGFASNVTGDTWTLTNTATTDALAHRVSIKNDSATDHSGKTALLTGTDADDRVLTETVQLPAGSATVESVGYFKTLTSIVPSASIGADTMDIGWVDEFVSNTIPYNWHGDVSGHDINVSGTINYTYQYSYSDIQRDTTFVWNDSNDTTVVNATTDKTTNITYPVMATRLKINSYSSGATIKLATVQMDSVC